MTTDVRVAIVYHSGYGHTERQARAVAEGVRSVAGASAQLISVDQAELHWADLDVADAIIFGAPTYFGAASAAFKRFAEASVTVWADGLRWRDKLAAGFTNSKTMSGDKLNTLLSFVILASQHGMQWVGLDLYPGWHTTGSSPEELNRLGSWVGAMAQSNSDASPEEAPSASDLRTAAHLGRRVGLLAQRWASGRAEETVAREEMVL
jgi:NAD(P)H dehydrogenase (quinone)